MEAHHTTLNLNEVTMGSDGWGICLMFPKLFLPFLGGSGIIKLSLDPGNPLWLYGVEGAIPAHDKVECTGEIAGVLRLRKCKSEVLKC